MIAITDHGLTVPDAPAHVWHYRNMCCLPRIANGVAILRGIEANILPDGSIDCDDTTSGMLDFVMAGLHHPVMPRSASIDENTFALVKAIESGKVDIISHPANPLALIDADAVVEAAVSSGVALEINSSKTSRTGSESVTVELIKKAHRAGAVLCMGSDAHCPWSVGDFEKGYEYLSAAGVSEESLINSSERKLADFLIARGRLPKIKDLLQERNLHLGQSVQPADDRS